MPSQSTSRPASASVELRVRPLSPEEYALWQTERGTDLGLPARPGTTEVGVLVYARTGPVANALVRAEPGVRLTAEIRVLDVADPGLTDTVVGAIVANFQRGGYTHFRAWTAHDATEPFRACGFEVMGRDFTSPVVSTPPAGRSRLGRRKAALTVEAAQDKDAASMIAWLTSARTKATLPRTPDRAALRTLLGRPDQHVLVFRDGDGAVVADAWVKIVEATGRSGAAVRGAVLDALRLRGGLDAAAIDAVDDALHTWCREQGLSALDLHVPAGADRRLIDEATRRGYRDAGTQLELTLPDEDAS